MAWLVLTFGVALCLAGIIGQFFGLRKRTLRPEDRRAGFFVLRIVSAVAGLWLVFISIAKVAHLGFTGKW
jgi:dolichol kinase